jgi:MFS family permease
MGWLSKGHEGPELTKRFGFYNIAWGLANMLLPVAGGYLMEINYLVPIASAAIFMFLGLIAVYDVPNPVLQSKIHINRKKENPIEQLNPLNRQFFWISKVALLSIYICVGMYRSQLGILYKYELGFGESIFGWSVAIMCLFNVTVFYIMGRSHFWHYKKGWYIFSQLVMVTSMIIIVFSANLYLQLFAAGISGFSYAVMYSSHQFYCIAGGRRRAGRMAIHETIIGAGYAIGSISGGLISDHFGRRWPYIFGCILVLTGAVIQIILWFLLNKKDQISSNAKTSFLTSPT